MISSYLTLSLSVPAPKSKLALPTTSAALLASLRPSLLRNLKPFHHHHLHLYQRRRRRRRRIIGNGGTCRASGLSHDAPFAFAIGASVLTSLLFPVTGAPDDDAGDSALDSTDSRFAVMAIISFIPYFNWLSWVFAWLDTGKRRYAVYSLVYLAPYFRSNLSLSPEESWLPIASIVICIIHVQLEASIRNGDLQGFQLFSEALKNVSSTSRKKDQLNVQQGTSEKAKKRDGLNLPSSDKESRNKIRGWQVPRRSPDNNEHLNEDRDEDQNDDNRRKH